MLSASYDTGVPRYAFCLLDPKLSDFRTVLFIFISQCLVLGQASHKLIKLTLSVC